MDKNRMEEESKLLLQSEEESHQPGRKGKRHWLVVLLILGGLSFGGYRWWHMARSAAADTTTLQSTDNAGNPGKGGRGGRGSRGGAGRAAVVTVAARKVNMPVYLRGLGTAVASNTVTVRSRVDGQLVHVAFKEGQFINQGDLLAELDKRPFEVQLAQAKGQLARDEALLQSAKTEQQRNQLLLDKGLIPRQQFDTQALSVGQYEGAIQSDQAQIDSANLQITYSRIIAPISGQIGLRLVDEGNIVRAGDPGGIVVITQLQPISVLFSIPEDDLADVLRKLHAGQQLRVEAWDHDDTKKIADGILLTADNQIDPTTGTSKLKSVFDNKNNALFPNQFVNVRLLIDVLKDAVVVPAATIQRGSQGTFVYVIKDNQTAEMHPVTIRNSESNDVALASGVAAGEMVVLEGMDKIQDGAKVDVQTPGQTPGQRARTMNISQPFILRPVATSLLMAGVLLAGAVAYRQLPVSALPQVDYPTIQVVTFYPGASPDVMSSSVTAPLERQFGQVPGLKQMTSTSSFGCSVITLQFSLELSIDIAEQEVQAAINAGGTFLPRDLPNPPIYSKVNPADTPILTLALTSRTLPLPKVEDLADTTLAQKISQLQGVGLVRISGGQKPGVRIRVNPTALASYGLGLEDIRAALASANVDQAKGNFESDQQIFTIGANDQIMSSTDYQKIIVAYRKGAPVRLADVAGVVDDVENTKQAAWMNNQPAVIVNIQRQPGANIIAVVDRIKALLPQLKASLPSSVDVAILTDRTTTIRASVNDVQFELMLTIALVVMVMFIFLRNFAATVIPSVAVPLSLVGAFGLMYLMGFSLNNLTLMALTISTGFVVDDAVVMIENIARYIEEGEPPLQAALKGSSQIGFTILSLTVSLIAVLIPLLFMGDVVGRLFREFAMTLSLTILVSAVVSLTLTPMMCAKLLRHKKDSEQSWFYRASGHAFDAIISAYARTLRWVLRHQRLTQFVTLCTLAATILLYIFVPKGFFPVQDTGAVLGVSESDQSISFPAMARRQQALAQVILQDPDVESLSSFIGIDGTNTTVNSGRMQINLKPHDQRKADASEIIRRLQPELAKVEGITLFMQPVQDLSVDDRVSRTQFQYSLEDADAKELNTWAPRLVEKLQALPQLRDVASDQQTEGLQATLVIDRDSAARFGITPQMIDDTLYDAFGQRLVSTMFTQLNQYHVVLEVEPRFQQNPDSLKDIYVRAPGGTQVPLSSFTRLDTHTTPLAVNHQGQFPAVTLSFNLAPDVSLGDAVKAIEDAGRDIGLPAGVGASFQGTALAFQSSLSNEVWLILAALITVYIVLGVLYESYIHPITILSTLPSAGLGALLALKVTHGDLSVIALIGMILLIGIVQKNAIMMIDFALEAQRREGKRPIEAIYQACLLRFRPIMMTTLAALLGGVPLALGTGVGSELRHPLGITIVGGLIVSQMLTLYTVPVVYLTFDRIAFHLRGLHVGNQIEEEALVEHR